MPKAISEVIEKAVGDAETDLSAKRQKRDPVEPSACNTSRRR